MKKWLIIILSIVLLILLVVRIIITENKNADEEKHWYVTQLHLDVTGEIDSIKPFNEGKQGRMFFHLTEGSIEKSFEKRLNNKLKYNEYLRFLFFKNGDEIMIQIFQPSTYSPGDSLKINTDENSIRTYRNGKEITNNEILRSVRVNPL